MLAADTFGGRTALVTGGGTGLGKAIAVELARAGAGVAVASRSAEHRDAGVAAVTAVGAKATGVELDVREPESIAAAFDAAESALGPISILVNNAAANFPIPAADLTPNGWRAVERIVLDGTFFCSQELHRRVVERSDATAASIVNIVTTAAMSGGPGMVHSAAAKAGVVSLTKTLAVEWAPRIRVNAIAPGLFPHDDLPDAIKAARDPSVDDSRQPAGRVGQPQELGWAATWLCSPYASFITGHVLVVDGGNWLRRDFAMPPVTPISQQIPKRQ